MMYNCENCFNWFDDDWHPVQYLLIDSKECEICEDCATICNPLDFERCDISGHLVANSNHDALITYWIEQYSSANLTCIKATRTGPETVMTGVFNSVDLAIEHASKLESALPA